MRRGDYTIRWATNNVGSESDAGIFAYERVYKGERALVVINSKKCAARIESGKCAATVAHSNSSYQGTAMKTGFADGATLTNVYPDNDKNDEFKVSAGTVDVKVPCQGWKILLKK